MTNTKLPISARNDFDTDHGFDELMVGFKRHLRSRGLADGTVNQRLLHVSTLHANHPNLLTVTTDDLELFLSRRRHTHAPESRRSMRSSWQSFFQWLKKSGRIETDPAAELMPIRLPKVVARIAPDDKVIGGLLGANATETAMVLLGRFGALRLSEIASLHSRHREGDVLRVVGKGDHTRMVPLNPELLEALQKLEQLQGDGFYFRGRYGGYMHPQSVNKIIQRVTGCNPHSLRHAALTSAYEVTHDIRAVQELAGHSSLATTERYLHVRVESVRAAAEATSFRKAS